MVVFVICLFIVFIMSEISTTNDKILELREEIEELKYKQKGGE